MADPYATKAPDLSGRPTGPPPWMETVVGRGGAITGRAGEIGSAPSFVVVHCRGIGTLAPIARVEPALATLLWLEHAASPRSASAANELLSTLRGVDVPLLAIKQGCVGGPADRPGCTTVDGSLIDPVLEGGGQVAWEIDPDFGYEVPGEVPGIDGVRARALLPRLLYADNDRVYEHADLVARKKRERFDLTKELPGLAPEIAAASGWPPPATDWRELE